MASVSTGTDNGVESSLVSVGLGIVLSKSSADSGAVMSRRQRGPMTLGVIQLKSMSSGRRSGATVRCTPNCVTRLITAGKALRHDVEYDCD